MWSIEAPGRTPSCTTRRLCLGGRRPRSTSVLLPGLRLTVAGPIAAPLALLLLPIRRLCCISCSRLCLTSDHALPIAWLSPAFARTSDGQGLRVPDRPPSVTHCKFQAFCIISGGVASSHWVSAACSRLLFRSAACSPPPPTHPPTHASDSLTSQVRRCHRAHAQVSKQIAYTHMSAQANGLPEAYIRPEARSAGPLPDA